MRPETCLFRRTAPLESGNGLEHTAYPYEVSESSELEQPNMVQSPRDVFRKKDPFYGSPSTTTNSPYGMPAVHEEPMWSR